MRFTRAVLFGAEKAVETLQERHRGKRWALRPRGCPCLQELSCEVRLPEATPCACAARGCVVNVFWTQDLEKGWRPQEWR